MAKLFERDGRTRIAETPADEVNLVADGFTVVEGSPVPPAVRPKPAYVPTTPKPKKD